MRRFVDELQVSCQQHLAFEFHAHTARLPPPASYGSSSSRPQASAIFMAILLELRRMDMTNPKLSLFGKSSVMR